MNTFTIDREASKSEKRLGWIPFPNPFYTRDVCQREISRLNNEEKIEVGLIEEADRANLPSMSKAILRMNLLGIQNLRNLFQVRLEQAEQKNNSPT